MKHQQHFNALAAALILTGASAASAQPPMRPLVANRALAFHERVKAQLPLGDRATANAIVAYVRGTLKHKHKLVTAPAVAAVVQDVLPELPQGQSADLTQYVVNDLGNLQTAGNQTDSANEMSEMESLRLQMAMDRVSKFMQTLSNIEKKDSDTDAAIIQNMK